MSKTLIRLIKQQDNQAVKDLVVETLAEFGLHGEGFAGVDAELNDMYGAYDNDLSAYFVVEFAGEVTGVGGYAPLLGTEPGSIAELRKMYLRPVLRGQGVGQELIDLCISEATAKGYQSMYLETVPEMQAAQALYLKNGFEYLSQRLGNTGHSNCHVCMSRVLND